MSACFYSDLDDDSLLLLDGAGIAPFLQGQLSCDTRQASAEHTVPGALCNARGRVLADLRLLLPAAEQGLLRLSRDLQAETAAVLAKYAMFSRIAVSADDSAWQIGGLRGPGAEALISEACGAVPATPNAAVAAADWLVVRCDEAGTAFECYFRGDAGSGLRTRLRERASVAAAAHWRADELRRGLLRLSASQAQRHLPQALNYDLAGLVSFQKGCYTGQEVVARLHYRGRAKRRLALYRAPAGTAAAAGDMLESEDGSALGEVLRTAAEPEGTVLLAALVRVEQLAQPARTAAGDALAPIPWPYAVDGS
jgi:folate-binding protein YgfZ